MKTFLFDSFNKYKRFSESLDVETTLCNKAWFVFNNSGEKEIYIFQEKGKLKISLNGKVTHATWEYIPANKSLIISGNEQSYMVHAAYMDNILFALQIDGTEEYVFLIDENNLQDFFPQSYNDLQLYFQIKEQKLIEKEEKSKRLSIQKKEEEEKLRKKHELQRRTDEITHINSFLLASIFLTSLAVSMEFLSLLFTISNAIKSPIIYFLSFIGLLCCIVTPIIIPFFTIKFIARKKAEKWKKSHPNDPVNQYL